MLVECTNCGAPLKVGPKNRFVTCRYCDRTNQVRSLETLAMQAPKGWTPPKAWRPPEDAPEPSTRELSYHQGVKHHVTRARNNKKGCSFAGCFIVIIPLVPFLITFFADTDLQALFDRLRGAEATPILGTISLSPPGGSNTRQGTTAPSQSASSVGNPSCSGQIPIRPHLALAVQQPTQLIASTRGSDDLTLLVQSPDGTIRCDDDSGGDRQALLSIPLEPGVHRLWVGTFSATDASFEVALEWDAIGEMPGPDGLAHGAPPELGELRVEGEETVGSFVGEVRGISAASEAQPGCDGYLPAQPQARVRSDDPFWLEVVTESDVDLVMLLRAQDGTIHCDDDSGGNRQPRLGVSLPAGDHAVWVGTFSQNEQAPFSMVVTARGPDAAPGPEKKRPRRRDPGPTHDQR